MIDFSKDGGIDSRLISFDCPGCGETNTYIDHFPKDIRCLFCHRLLVVSDDTIFEVGNGSYIQGKKIIRTAELIREGCGVLPDKAAEIERMVAEMVAEMEDEK